MAGICPREVEIGSAWARMSEFYRFRIYVNPKGVTVIVADASGPTSTKIRKNTCFQTPTTEIQPSNRINDIGRKRGARPKLLCSLESTNRGLAPKLKIAFYLSVHSRRQASRNQQPVRDSKRKGTFNKSGISAECENGNLLWNQQKRGRTQFKSTASKRKKQGPLNMRKIFLAASHWPLATSADLAAATASAYAFGGTSKL
jgi:hypothetical protein